MWKPNRFHVGAYMGWLHLFALTMFGPFACNSLRIENVMRSLTLIFLYKNRIDLPKRLLVRLQWGPMQFCEFHLWIEDQRINVYNYAAMAFFAPYDRLWMSFFRQISLANQSFLQRNITSLVFIIFDWCFIIIISKLSNLANIRPVIISIVTFVLYRLSWITIQCSFGHKRHDVIEIY